MTKLLRPSEVCALLGVSSKTLQRWRHSDRLTRGVHYFQYGPKTIRYDAEWLKRFMATGGRGSHKLDVANYLTSIEQSTP